MSNDTISLLFWLLGWILLSGGCFVYNAYINNKSHVSKKLIAWRSFWNGFFSWVGIIVLLVCGIIACIIAIDTWVENKLSK